MKSSVLTVADENHDCCIFHFLPLNVRQSGRPICGASEIFNANAVYCVTDLTSQILHIIRCWDPPQWCCFIMVKELFFLKSMTYSYTEFKFFSLITRSICTFVQYETGDTGSENKWPFSPFSKRNLRFCKF